MVFVCVCLCTCVCVVCVCVLLFSRGTSGLKSQTCSRGVNDRPPGVTSIDWRNIKTKSMYFIPLIIQNTV